MTTRREMLTAFLGAPLAAALSGCGGPAAAPPLPAGEIVGAADGFGHQLRDGLRPVPPPESFQQCQVLIVGGGVAGLAAAWKLQQAGLTDFALLELENAPGGTSRSGKSSVSAFPWGAHYLPAPQKENRELVALLDEMGVLEGRDSSGQPIVAEQFLCRDPHERIFKDGQWHLGMYLQENASDEDLRQFAAFKAEAGRWSAWRDGRGRRAFALPIADCSDDAEVTALDHMSMAEFLEKKGFNSPRLKWYVEYACRDDHGTLLQSTSAWAGLFYFASRLEQPGEDAQPLITWPEGNGRLVEHLHKKAGPRVKLGLAATDIFEDSGGGAGIPARPSRQDAGATKDAGWVVVHAYDRAEQIVVGFRARHVIFAAPQFMAKHLLRAYRERPPEHIAKFEYGAWMVANLALKNRPKETGAPLCWDNVLYDSPSLGYIVATHQACVDYGPTVFTYYYPFCDDKAADGRARLLAGNREQWAELALSDLSAAHPDIRALTERLDVMRWGHGMIQPRPGFMWSGARQKAMQPAGRVHFAHSDLSGMALFEEAFYHGVRAAGEVLAAHG